MLACDPTFNSPRHLRVLCVSAVMFFWLIHRGDAKYAEKGQRKTQITTSSVYLLRLLLLIVAMTSLVANAFSQQPTARDVPERAYAALKWRCIGPHRGGRVLAVSGVRGQPNT